eukprot:6176335-Pleurochrysis_carterae.AAC.2
MCAVEKRACRSSHSSRERFPCAKERRAHVLTQSSRAALQPSFESHSSAPAPPSNCPRAPSAASRVVYIASRVLFLLTRPRLCCVACVLRASQPLKLPPMGMPVVEYLRHSLGSAQRDRDGLVVLPNVRAAPFDATRCRTRCAYGRRGVGGVDTEAAC